MSSEASIFALIGLNKHSFVQKITFTIKIEYSAVLAVEAAQKHGSLRIKTMSEVNSITQDCLKTWNMLFHFAEWYCCNSKIKLGFYHELICSTLVYAELTQLGIITTKVKSVTDKTFVHWTSDNTNYTMSLTNRAETLILK